MLVQANTWYWVTGDQFARSKERFQGPPGPLDANHWYVEQMRLDDGSEVEWDPFRLAPGEHAVVGDPFDVIVQDLGRHTRLVMPYS